jgi:hypothetical protein
MFPCSFIGLEMTIRSKSKKQNKNGEKLKMVEKENYPEYPPEIKPIYPQIPFTPDFQWRV